MFESIKSRIATLPERAHSGLSNAAAEIQRKFRKDATTKRGNVPSFGKMGDIPIVAEVRPESVAVTGPAWRTAIARERGQTEDWKRVVVSKVNDAVKR